MFRELVTRPVSMLSALLEMPRTLERSVRHANELIEVSRTQLEIMRRQADEALEQAERMNDLLARIVRLTEPLEKAQRGGEFVSEQLRRVIFGEDRPTSVESGRVQPAASIESGPARIEPAAASAEAAATHAEDVELAEEAAEQAEDAADQAER